MQITKKFSPNYDSRNGIKPQFICIHIGEGSGRAIINEFASPKTEKSSHYLINRDGSIVQFVDEILSAWANGIVWQPSNELIKANYLAGISINKLSISIEAEGYASEEPTIAYYKSVSKLVKEIAERWQILLDAEHVIPHRAIRRDKTCPGKISCGKILDMIKSAPIEFVPTPQPQWIPPKPTTSLPGWYVNFLERFKK